MNSNRKRKYDTQYHNNEDSDNEKPNKIRFIKSKDVNTLKELLQLVDDEDNKNVFYVNINTNMLKRIKPHLKELDELIGLEDIKKSILEQILYYLQSMHRVNKNEYLHTVIYGNPGTGKTTIAKILSNIYAKLGILSKNSFKIATRADLIGGYLGQTTLKTKALLESAKGGVLFLDEIYSLGSGGDKQDSYSKECIDCINLFCSENKNDFCLIVAGYEEEVKKCFFSVNQGLERRFLWYHKIADYSEKDLANITLKMIKDIEWQTIVNIEQLCTIIKPHLKTVFKNAGGSVENWITKTKLAHSKRVFTLNYEEKYILNIEDFRKSLDTLLKNNKVEDDTNFLNLYI